MNRTGIPYLDFGWNPCGFGCSRGCETCWARAMTRRLGSSLCSDCKAFNVHMHYDRLEGKHAPAARKKPAVVGVQFTGELFDPQRPECDILAVLSACLTAPQHEYVFLTQQPKIAARMFRIIAAQMPGEHLPANWHVGATVRNQNQMLTTQREFIDLPGKVWLSLEPLEEEVNTGLCRQDYDRKPHELGRGGILRPCSSGRHWVGMVDVWCGVEGVVIGCDNQMGQKYDPLWIRRTLDYFIGVPTEIYLKQIRMWKCSRCGGHFTEDLVGHKACPECGLPQSQFHAVLVEDAEKFPDDLKQFRQLPWTLTMAPKKHA